MTRYPSRDRLVLATAAVAFLGIACAKKDAPASTDSTAAVAAPGTSQDALMQKGLDQLYKGNDANAAAATFREVLAVNPTHYGARFQLAKATDRAGKPAEARPMWEAVLTAAESIKDSASAQTARTRLAQPDTVSQEAMMGIGLALGAGGDAAGAANEFRKVLERNPQHYGAHLQLAKALDRAGKPAEARPVWQQVLTLAQQVKDSATIKTAATRLARNP